MNKQMEQRVLIMMMNYSVAYQDMYTGVPISIPVLLLIFPGCGRPACGPEAGELPAQPQDLDRLLPRYTAPIPTFPNFRTS